MEKRIGFGPRLGAYLLDIVFIWVLSALVSRIAPSFFSATASQQLAATMSTNPALAGLYNSSMTAMMESIIRVSLLTTVIEVIYFIPEILFGASLGKMLLRLKITNVDGDSASIGILVARYLLKHISTICSVLALFSLTLLFNSLGSLLGLVIFIGCFFAAGDKHQALHDLMCHTIVVKKEENGEG